MTPDPELVTLACCDLSGLTRGRSVPAGDLDAHLVSGIGWVPANHALTPHGPVAEDAPFDSTGDLRLLPDAATRARVPASASSSALDLVLCDVVETDGAPWSACPRTFLLDTLAELEEELGLTVTASFEHEFQLLREEAGEVPFSVVAQRRAEPFPTELMTALTAARLEPERIFAEYAPHQLEVPLAAARGLAAADRAVIFREVVREVARRCGERATFTPLLDPEQAGNGMHLHFSLADKHGSPVLYDATREGCVSELGGQFAAGVLRHASALVGLTAPSPVSAGRLQPHHWSAGAACLGLRNREALLRLPPLVSLGGGDLAAQMRFEYRAADGTANPYVVLAAVLRAGMGGVRSGLEAPPILDRDPSQLDAAEAQRFGVGALPPGLAEALAALEADDEARAWLPDRLLAAHMAIKRSELDASARLDPEELCRRYARIY
ncbi:MAG TPA: glutamine synthetase family protein [Solirubrobacteraceae bacterium]|jgi:glutamine synthetase|nr:glutamine synthetase family protein [Solirubrobacteraceae bacterium]